MHKGCKPVPLDVVTVHSHSVQVLMAWKWSRAPLNPLHSVSKSLCVHLVVFVSVVLLLLFLIFSRYFWEILRFV